jgi:hypothetical protein
MKPFFFYIFLFVTGLCSGLFIMSGVKAVRAEEIMDEAVSVGVAKRIVINPTDRSTSFVWITNQVKTKQDN